MRTDSKRVMIQVKLPKDTIKQLDHLALDIEAPRYEVLERIVRNWFEKGGDATQLQEVTT